MAYNTPYRLVLESDDQPSTTIIKAVASILGTGSGELQPLNSVLDSRFLDGLHRTNSEATITFTYEGFHVTVHPNGEILLRDPESVHTSLGNVSNVLLLEGVGDEDGLCSDLVHPYPPQNENILHVVVDQTIDETVNAHHSMDRPRPAEQKIISLGEIARSVGTQTVTLSGPIEVDLIPDKRLS